MSLAVAVISGAHPYTEGSLVQEKVNVGRVILIEAGIFRGDLKGDLQLAQTLPCLKMVWKSVFHITAGKPEDSGIKVLREGKGIDVVHRADQMLRGGKTAGRSDVAGDKIPYLYVIQIKMLFLLWKLGEHIDDNAVMTGADQLHGSAFAGAGLDLDETGGNELADMHGDGAVCQSESFCKIIHADSGGCVNDFHDLHPHGSAQRFDNFLRFIKGRQVEHRDTSFLNGSHAVYFFVSEYSIFRMISEVKNELNLKMMNSDKMG